MTDMQFATTAEQAEQFARLTLDRVRWQFEDNDSRQRAINADFDLAADDAHGSFVGRDPEHGLGVTTPFWTDLDVVGDIDYCAGWRTVHIDGFVDVA